MIFEISGYNEEIKQTSMDIPCRQGVLNCEKEVWKIVSFQKIIWGGGLTGKYPPINESYQLNARNKLEII